MPSVTPVLVVGLLCLTGHPVVAEPQAEVTVYKNVPNMPTKEVAQVMTWIQLNSELEKLPFCWRHTHTRGFGSMPGEVAACPEGYTNLGLFCGKGADSIWAPSKPADCPKGYTNIGFACYKKAQNYWKKCTIPFWKKYPCKKGYTDIGCLCTILAKTLSAGSMTCPDEGYEKSKWTNRCIQICPKGYTNTGETCFRGVRTLGVGSMTCPEGQERKLGRCYPKGRSCPIGQESSGGLCYDKCRPGFDGQGPVCWETCPAGWVKCGAGCARTSGECGKNVVEMVLAPVLFSMKVARLGLTEVSAAASSNCTENCRPTVVVDGREVEGVTEAGNRLVQAIAVLEGAQPDDQAGMVLIERVFDATTGKVMSGVATVKKHVPGKVYDAVESYVSAYVDDFARETSTEINQQIEENFSQETALFLKEAWGKAQLAELANSNGWKISANLLDSALFVANVTGLARVVGAFAKPMCPSPTDTAFPCVTGSAQCNKPE